MLVPERGGPDLHIPAEALQRPAGAAIDQAGHVTCVMCRNRVPLANADVVGMGYRCAPCSHRAEITKLTGGGDAAAHFSQAGRQALSESGLQVIFGGLIFMALGVLLLVVWPLRWRWGIGTIVGGGAMVGVGMARRNAAH